MNSRADLLSRAVTWFAQHGVGETSLRALATGIGTSHRMLNYHFGSRAGLLAAVVVEVERTEQEALSELLAASEDPFEAAALSWIRVADHATTFAPLFFELSTHAMHRRPHAEPLRAWLATGWTDALAGLFDRRGLGPAAAQTLALQCLAMTRGLLFELAVTNDRGAVDTAMAHWIKAAHRVIAAPESWAPQST